MGFMDLAKLVYGAMPGGLEGAVMMCMIEGEGPVATKTRDGAYHVAYARLAYGDDPEGAWQEERPPPGVKILYQETFSDPFRAGTEYRELYDFYVGVVRELPGEPPGLAEKRRRYHESDLIERKLEEQRDTQRYMIEGLDDDLEAFGLKG